MGTVGVRRFLQFPTWLFTGVSSPCQYPPLTLHRELRYGCHDIMTIAYNQGQRMRMNLCLSLCEVEPQDLT